MRYAALYLACMLLLSGCAYGDEHVRTLGTPQRVGSWIRAQDNGEEILHGTGVFIDMMSCSPASRSYSPVSRGAAQAEFVEVVHWLESQPENRLWPTGKAATTHSTTTLLRLIYIDIADAAGEDWKAGRPGAYIQTLGMVEPDPERKELHMKWDEAVLRFKSIAGEPGMRQLNEARKGKVASVGETQRRS